MANVAEFKIDMTDLKVLTDHLNTAEKKVDMLASSAGRDFKKLQLAIDPVKRATKAFKDQVLIAQKALVVGEASQKEYADALNRIQANAKSAGITINQFGQVTDVNTRKMKRFGAVGMQQVGYQVQDFAVQVQGGTNMLVALGQQGSQLLGIFGPAGAIAGMILAIGTGLAGAFMAAKKASDQSSTSFATYSEAMKTAKDRVKALKLENFMLANSIKTVEEATLIASINNIKAQRDEWEANQRLLGDLAVFDSPAEERIAAGDGLGPIRHSFEKKIANLEKLLAETRRGLAENDTLTSSKEASEDAAERLTEGRELLSQIQEQYNAAKRLEGLEGRKLFIKKQDLEIEKQLRELSLNGLSIDTDEFWEASRLLEMNKDIAIVAYDKAQAEKDAAQAIRDQAKALQAAKKAAAEAKKAAEEANKQYAAVSKSIESSMESAMMSMVDGTKSVKEAFKSMASEIIKELYRIFVVKKITGMITGTFDALGSVGAPSMGTRANGGPVMGGGSYLVGERGPEMFTPSMGGGHITPASQTNAGGVTIVQNINVSTGVQQTVRSEIRQMMPQIAQSAKGAVLDAKRRGGSYGSAMA